LFTSVRGGTQSDIYRYDIVGGTVTQVTNTPESEYSPIVTPAGALSVVRVELDKDRTQRLWQFTADGSDPHVVLDAIKPVGYHAWVDDHTLVLFVLGQPPTLQVVDTKTGTSASSHRISRDPFRRFRAATRLVSFSATVRAKPCGCWSRS
jgi:hypothetical protein